jgi:hypothetical protein
MNLKLVKINFFSEKKFSRKVAKLATEDKRIWFITKTQSFPSRLCGFA